MPRRQSRNPNPAHQHDAGGAEEERNLTGRSALASLVEAAVARSEREVAEKRRAAARDGMRLLRAGRKAKRTPSKVLSFAADASLDGRVPTPAASVHHAKAAVIKGIVNRDLLENRHVPQSGIFYRWNREGKLQGLFGDGVFEPGDDAYVRSALASNRFSYELPADDPWVKRLVEHVGGRLEALGILHDERHFCGGATLLLSKQGAPQQSWHTDYKWCNRIFKKGLLPHSGCVPYPVSVLIALHEEGAVLRVRDGDDIFVDRYGAVVFRGDLTHAGAEWKGASFNWRIHLYFDTMGREWMCKVPRVREARGGEEYITVIEPPNPE
jgi:hypothetical protein